MREVRQPGHDFPVTPDNRQLDGTAARRHGGFPTAVRVRHPPSSSQQRVLKAPRYLRPRISRSARFFVRAFFLARGRQSSRCTVRHHFYPHENSRAPLHPRSPRLVRPSRHRPKRQTRRRGLHSRLARARSAAHRRKLRRRRPRQKTIPRRSLARGQRRRCAKVGRQGTRLGQSRVIDLLR